MTKLSQEEENRKRAIFEQMSPKRQEKILKKGYDQWDPFAPPRDPIDLRRDQTRHTAAMLVKRFLATRSMEEYSNAYGQGAWDICVGIMSDSDRYIGMYEFSCWYNDFLKKGDQGLP
jgi:hypothetical protein